MPHQNVSACNEELSAASASLKFIPPKITPPRSPLGRFALLRAFVRNPLEAVPQAVYERDIYAYRGRVWITSSPLIRTVLLDEHRRFRKLSTIRLLGPLLGRGLLTSEGPEWKWQRQAAAPMFRQQDLAAFVPTFVRAAERLVERWRAAGDAVQLVDRDMTRITFEVISTTLLPSADTTVAPVIDRAMGAFQRWSGWGILYATTGMPRWLPRPGMFASARAVGTLRNAVRTLLDENRASGRDDLMQRLMSARDPESGRAMDENQLVDNLLTFYLAGHETTARALAWTLYLLARYPQWAERLRDDASLVPLVLKESMRLYPPVPLMARQVIEDVQLGDMHVAPGSTVLMPIYAIHRHTKLWRDPDAFDPLRFAPESEAKLERYQYMPFGAGPRICIGMGFAMLEATTILATLLKRVRLSPVPGRDPHPVARVTLLPRGGVPLRISVP